MHQSHITRLLRTASGLSLAIACFLISHVVEVKAVDLWPEISLEVSAHSTSSDRGIRLSDEFAAGVKSSLAFDPFEAMLYAEYSEDEARQERYLYDIRLEALERKISAGIGLRGSVFEYLPESAVEDRTELYIFCGSDPGEMTMVRWGVSVACGLDGSDALYGDLHIAGTRSFGPQVDCDAEISLGVGDEHFARKQSAIVGSPGAELDSWVNASGRLSIPIMFRSFDLSPSLEYSATLNGSARNLIESSGGASEFWTAALAVIFYFD